MNPTSTNAFRANDSVQDLGQQPPAQPPVPARGAGMKVKVAAGLIAVGLLSGGAWAITRDSSTGTAATSASASAGTTQAGSAQAGPAQAGTAQDGTAPGAPAGAPGSAPGGAPSGMTPPVNGTIAAVSATSISVKTTSGTSTFEIASGAVIENNGAVATADSLTVGEQVVVFTGAGPGAASSSGTESTAASRIMAGSSATAGPGAGMGTAPSGA
jgi:hypothetical protein